MDITFLDVFSFFFYVNEILYSVNLFLLQKIKHQQKIAMSPDILECSTFIELFILYGNSEVIISYMSKRVKKSIFEKNDVVTS